MKTFKLKMLEIINYETKTYEMINIPLIDGLIINREDKENRWLMEAYIRGEYLDIFTNLKEKYDELIVHVKITTEANEKATCITSIIDINQIGNNINVLLLGKMAEQRTAKLEQVLKKLVEDGNKGTELLNKFKEYM